jgi:hypothetical protein
MIQNGIDIGDPVTQKNEGVTPNKKSGRTGNAK